MRNDSLMSSPNLAFAVERQVWEKTRWFQSLEDIYKKFKMIKTDHAKLSEEALEYKRSLADMAQLTKIIQSTVDVLIDQFTPLGYILYKAPSDGKDGKWGEYEVDYLLFIVRNVNLHPNPDEVVDVKYVYMDQLKEISRKAHTGEDSIKLSSWFRLVVDNFLFKWWDHVEKGTFLEVADVKTIHKLT